MRVRIEPPKIPRYGQNPVNPADRSTWDAPAPTAKPAMANALDAPGRGSNSRWQFGQTTVRETTARTGNRPRRLGHLAIDFNLFTVIVGADGRKLRTAATPASPQSPPRPAACHPVLPRGMVDKRCLPLR